MERPIVAMILPPKEGFGPGATGAVGLLLRRLARPDGFRPMVVGMDLGARFTGVEFRAAKLSRLPGKVSWRYARGVAAVLRVLRPAMVEVHNRPDIAAYLARRFPAVPVCLVLHNDPQGMRWTRTVAQRGALLRRLALVVGVSDWVRRRMLEGVSGEAAVLANCLDLREVPASPLERERVILFAGRVVADKGADAFVAACGMALPRLPGWRAEMIGADRFGPDSPETDFLRGLRPQAAAAGVAMLGYRPHDQVLEAMARAAIVVVPSRWAEPFGLTALEALACGAGLLYAPRGGLPEVVGEAGLAIDPDDAAGMADALVALAGDPARLAAMGAAGRARAAGFDVPVALGVLDGLRRAVLGTWPKPPAMPI
jgi:UDP-glucose:(glucosyl)LPS alpha-1,2-glucosyltransferase